MNRSRKEQQTVNSSFSNKIKVERTFRKKDLSVSSDLNSMPILAQPLVMSTPKRSARLSKPLDQSSEMNRSRSSLSRNDSFLQKKYHDKYDANIELRQVNERFNKRQSNSWADQSLLNDEEGEDLMKYTEKLAKRNKDIKLETDTERLAQRQCAIDKGKVKQCYRNYVYEIGKNQRKQFMPKTPNKFIQMSRRAWDGMVRKWKKHIHAWNEPNFEELYATGMEFDCCSESSMSIKTSQDHSDDNLSRLDDLLSVKDEPEDEEETLQGTKSRKRSFAPLKKENYDEDTIEKFPVMRESRLRDFHSGLTNDAAALSVAPTKRQRMSAADK